MFVVRMAPGFRRLKKKPDDKIGWPLAGAKKARAGDISDEVRRTSWLMDALDIAPSGVRFMLPSS